MTSSHLSAHRQATVGQRLLVALLVLIAGCSSGSKVDTAARDRCEAKWGVGNCVERDQKWVPLAAAISTASTATAPPTTAQPTAPPATISSTTIAPTTTPPTTTRAVGTELTGTSLGPLRLGMSIGDAMATGWLGSSLTTCVAALGLGAESGNELFDLKGPRAPAGLDATVETQGDRVASMIVNSKVGLPGGIDFEPTWDGHQAQFALQNAGSTMTLEDHFDPNDTGTGAFPDGSSFGMYFPGSASIGIPELRVCD